MTSVAEKYAIPVDSPMHYHSQNKFQGKMCIYSIVTNKVHESCISLAISLPCLNIFIGVIICNFFSVGPPVFISLRYLLSNYGYIIPFVV